MGIGLFCGLLVGDVYRVCNCPPVLGLSLIHISDVTGMQFEAMGELEYYVIADEEDLFPATDKRGYHESGPYAKFNQFRTQCMQYIAQDVYKRQVLNGRHLIHRLISCFRFPVQSSSDVCHNNVNVHKLIRRCV